MENIRDNIYKKLKAITGNRPSELYDEMRLKEDLGMDSIKFIMFFSAIASLLNLDIFDFADTELMTLETIKDVVHLFESKSLRY